MILYVHPYLGKISNLTTIFQMSWNHHPMDFCSVKKETWPCRNRCAEAAKVKALKKLKDGPGSEINSWRPSEDETAEEVIYREDPENVKEKKQRNTLKVEQKNSKKRWNDTSQS